MKRFCSISAILLVILTLAASNPVEASCVYNSFNCWNAGFNVCWGGGQSSVGYQGNAISTWSSQTTTECASDLEGMCHYVDVAIDSVCEDNPFVTYHIISYLCCRTF